MITQTSPDIAYCLNVFPGQTVRELQRTLTGPVTRLKQGVSPDAPFGIEMHVGQKLAQELSGQPRRFETLQRLLEEQGLHVLAINAFPIGNFHSERVKSDVFCPSWLEEARVATTMVAGEILARLLPGDFGSVSTSPGTYRGFGVDAYTRKAVARNMARVARHFAGIEARTGKRIVLSVEPEPWGMLETVEETIPFFDLLDECGAGILAQAETISGDFSNEDLVRRYVGINVDLCHQSVMFEDLKASYASLKAAGISIPKVHVSSALALSDPANADAGRELLLQLGEDRYLHQVMGLTKDGRVTRVASDLPLLADLSREELESLVQIRAHVHVPLHLSGASGCSTTSSETRRAIQLLMEGGHTELLVVETYTWQHVQDHVSELASTPHYVEGMAGEMGWLSGVVRDCEEKRKG